MAERAWNPSANASPWSRDSDALTVRPGAKALVSNSDKALLIQERHTDGSEFWTLPGGGMHPGESVSETLRRELAEELRCRCVPGDRISTFLYAHASLEDTVSVYAVNECNLLSRPTPTITEGVTDVQWVPPDSLPARTLPQVRRVVQRSL